MGVIGTEWRSEELNEAQVIGSHWGSMCVIGDH